MSNQKTKKIMLYELVKEWYGNEVGQKVVVFDMELSLIIDEEAKQSKSYKELSGELDKMGIETKLLKVEEKYGEGGSLEWNIENKFSSEGITKLTDLLDETTKKIIGDANRFVKEYNIMIDEAIENENTTAMELSTKLKELVRIRRHEFNERYEEAKRELRAETGEVDEDPEKAAARAAGILKS